MSQTELVALIIPGIIVSFSALWIAISFVISRVGGWSGLARSFPGSEPVSGVPFHLASATFGMFTSYRNILTLMLSPSGLYMHTILPFRIGHEPLLIPWNAIVATKRSNVLFTQSLRLEIRDPRSGGTRRITFYGNRLVNTLAGYCGSGDATS